MRERHGVRITEGSQPAARPSWGREDHVQRAHDALLSAARGAQVRPTAPTRGAKAPGGRLARMVRSISRTNAGTSKMLSSSRDTAEKEAAEASLAEASQVFADDQSGSFEAQIDLEKLKVLRSLFEQADKDRGGDLDEQEFLAAFGPVLGGLDEQQLRLWFSRIDANANGHIDWDEFSTYILLEGQQRMLEEGVKYEFMRAQQHANRTEHYHDDMVTTVLVHPRNGRYYTTSRDGTVKIWNNVDSRYEGTLHNSYSWITDACFTRNSNRMMLSSIDRMVWIFECTTGQLYRTFMGKGKHTSDVKETVVRRQMDTRRGAGAEYNPTAVKRNLQQYAHMSFSEFQETMSTNREQKTPAQTVETIAMRNLSDSPMTIQHFCPPYSQREYMVLGCRNGVVQLYDPTPAGSGKPVIDFTAKYMLHNACISKLRTSDHLGGVISGSWDCSLKILNLETSQVIRTMGRDTGGHQKSIFSIDWNEELKLLASCGAERMVYIWNPFINKPVFKLEGHVAPLVHVIINDVGQSIVSMSTDKVLRIWDMRTFKCIQTFQDMAQYWPENQHSALAYDSKRQTIITASTHPVAWQLRRAVNQFEPDYNGHHKGVIRALHNEHFNQIVSADSETVIVWDVSTGERVCAFAPRHHLSNPNEQLTDIQFDTTGRRLISGTHTGQVVTWNYINGQVLNVFHKPPNSDSEVTATCHVVHPKQHFKFVLAAVGTTVIAWRDCESSEVRLTATYDHPYPVLCMEPLPDFLIALGSDAGIIHFMNINSMKECGHLGTYIPLVAVEDMLFLHKKATILVSALSSGYIQLWCTRTRQLLHQWLQSGVVDHAITRLATDRGNRYLGCGDEFGDVALYDISAMDVRAKDIVPHIHLRHALSFNGHKGPVSGLAIMAESSLIISSGLDMLVKVHTVDGNFVGYFGQAMRWHIGNPSSYTGPARPPTSEETRRRLGEVAATVGQPTLDGAGVGGGTNSRRDRMHEGSMTAHLHQLWNEDATTSPSPRKDRRKSVRPPPAMPSSPDGTATDALSAVVGSGSLVPAPPGTPAGGTRIPRPPPSSVFGSNTAPRMIPRSASAAGIVCTRSTPFGCVVVPSSPRTKFRRRGTPVAGQESRLVKASPIQVVTLDTVSMVDPPSPRTPSLPTPPLEEEETEEDTTTGTSTTLPKLFKTPFAPPLSFTPPDEEDVIIPSDEPQPSQPTTATTTTPPPAVAPLQLPPRPPGHATRGGGNSPSARVAPVKDPSRRSMQDFRIGPLVGGRRRPKAEPEVAPMTPKVGATATPFVFRRWEDPPDDDDGTGDNTPAGVVGEDNNAIAAAIAATGCGSGAGGGDGPTSSSVVVTGATTADIPTAPLVPLLSSGQDANRPAIAVGMQEEPVASPIPTDPTSPLSPSSTDAPCVECGRPLSATSTDTVHSTSGGFVTPSVRALNDRIQQLQSYRDEVMPAKLEYRDDDGNTVTADLYALSGTITAQVMGSTDPDQSLLRKSKRVAGNDTNGVPLPYSRISTLLPVSSPTEYDASQFGHVVEDPRRWKTCGVCNSTRRHGPRNLHYKHMY